MLLPVTLHVYICYAVQTPGMAEAAEFRRTARPTGGPNTQLLAKAQKKYKVFDEAATTEYDRLYVIDAKKRLNSTANPAEHAVFFHLCGLRAGIVFKCYYSNVFIFTESNAFLYCRFCPRTN